jgi:hypothetical protein
LLFKEQSNTAAHVMIQIFLKVCFCHCLMQ